MGARKMFWAALAFVFVAWLGYSGYRSEVRSRQALAYPAERVAYRLTQLTRYADGLSEAEWGEVSTRTWLYDSVSQIADFGMTAERIPTRGTSGDVARKLGLLARRFESYREPAHRLAFGGATAADRTRIIDLAREIRQAGWGGPGAPAGWTYGRDWAELSRALDPLVATQ